VNICKVALLVTKYEHRAKRPQRGAVAQLMIVAHPIDIAALDDAKLMDAAAPAANGFQLNGSAI